MTESEWFAMIDGTLNADTGAAAVVQLKDAITAELATAAGLASQNETLTAENKRLRDVNSQLALRVTSEVTGGDNLGDNEETPEAALESLINELKGES